MLFYRVAFYTITLNARLVKCVCEVCVGVGVRVRGYDKCCIVMCSQLALCSVIQYADRPEACAIKPVLPSARQLCDEWSYVVLWRNGSRLACLIYDCVDVAVSTLDN